MWEDIHSQRHTFDASIISSPTSMKHIKSMIFIDIRFQFLLQLIECYTLHYWTRPQSQSNANWSVICKFHSYRKSITWNHRLIFGSHSPLIIRCPNRCGMTCWNGRRILGATMNLWCESETKVGCLSEPHTNANTTTEIDYHLERDHINPYASTLFRSRRWRWIKNMGNVRLRSLADLRAPVLHSHANTIPSLKRGWNGRARSKCAHDRLCFDARGSVLFVLQ